MPVAMTPIIMLVVCKTVLVGAPDQNAAYTGWENREWATLHSMMQCRRLEVPVVDIDEIKGAKQQPFDQPRCARAAMMLIPQWNSQHKFGSYRAWRVACPVPIKNYGKDGVKGTDDDETIGWHLPACGHRDTVVCDVDSEV